MNKNENNLVWIDLEMTGLYPERDKILELAILVTDTNLKILAEGPVLAIYQNSATLAAMDSWNQSVHTKSGLVERVKNSTCSEQKAQQKALEFVSQWVSASKSPLCGNSVWQDRRFLRRYMPALDAHFHYRCIDVSTIKELAKRWQPGLIAGFKKQNNHQALADIRESVQELSYYRDHFLKIKA